MRAAAAFLVAFVLLAGCRDDRVRLHRGPLGPARYKVVFGVKGSPVIQEDDVEAGLRVEPTADGVDVRLAVAGEDPIVAHLKKIAEGGLVLDTVQGVPPSSAGEADLASIVAQLDPPLPARRVRLGDSWSSTRVIKTETIKASLTSRLRLLRFRRVGGTDAAELRGEVTGRLRTSGASGVFDGTVRGTTEISWSVEEGRVVASRTLLVWSIAGGGRLRVSTTVAPR